MPAKRENSSYAAIKCTICGERIKISLMGDHVCKSTVDLIRQCGNDRFNIQSHPQLRSSSSQRQMNLPRIDPLAASKPYQYAHDQLTPQSSTWGSSPGTPHDGYGFGSTIRSIQRKPVGGPAGMDFHPAGHRPPSPDQSPTGPMSPSFGRRTPGVDGSKSLLHRLDNMAPGPFQAGAPGGASGHRITRKPSMEPHHSHAPPLHHIEDRPRRMPEPDYYAPVRPLSTRSSRSQLRSKPSQDWSQPPIPRKPSVMSFGHEESGNYIAATKLADQQRVNRAEVDSYPTTESIPVPTKYPKHTEKRENIVSGGSPPHPGIGLPRKPSQTLNTHHRIPSSSTPPPTGDLPKRPLRRTPSSLSRSASRSQSPHQSQLSLGTGAIPPPMSISEAPPPPPPDAYSEYTAANPHSSTHNTTHSISSSSTAYSSSSGIKSGVSSITTPSTSDVDLRISNRAPKSMEKSPESSPPEKDDSKPKGRRRHGSKRSYSIWEIEDLTRSLLLSQQNSDAPAVPACLPDHIPARPISPASTVAHSRAASRAGSCAGPKRTPTSKGICRGCSQPIFGKSVSSADGRLTGRWHKPCFMCSTCHAPFSSAEFYVLDNLPYCERHYHELNLSLCPTCDKGIEGPCLETEHRQRFHPNCFTCSTCHEVLADSIDYYEVDGKPLCERHGRSLIQQQQAQQQQHTGMRRPSNLGPGLEAPSSKVEKRRTRLMFMDPNAPLGGNNADDATDWKPKLDAINQDIGIDPRDDINHGIVNAPSQISAAPNSNNLSVNARPMVAYSPSLYPESPISAPPTSPIPPPPIEKSPRHLGGEWHQQRMQPQPQPQQRAQMQAQRGREQYSGMRTGTGGPKMEGRMGIPDGLRPGLRAAAGPARMHNPMVRKPVDYYD